MLIPFILLFALKLSYGSCIFKHGEQLLTEEFRKPVNDGKLPIYFDWRDKGKVSPVKNQKHCNAGWAFSVIANIESHLSIHKNETETLSEQFLIDCDDSQQGCHGYGHVVASFKSIVTRLRGVIHEYDYPYRDGQLECKEPDPTPQFIKIPSFKYIQGDEEDMVKFLYKHGPLSAVINSKSMASDKYKPKTIDQPSDEECSPEDLSHAVLIVGYNVYVDEDKEIPYWIIKNSWGKEWGDHGYYFLERGRNACGIATEVAYAIVA